MVNAGPIKGLLIFEASWQATAGDIVLFSRPPTLSIGNTFVTSKALDTTMESIGYLVDWNCTKLLVSV